MQLKIAMLQQALLDSIHPGNPTKCEDVSDCIAAKAIASMNATGDFASCPQAFDRRSIGAQDACVSINYDATHSVVK